MRIAVIQMAVVLSFLYGFMFSRYSINLSELINNTHHSIIYYPTLTSTVLISGIIAAIYVIVMLKLNAVIKEQKETEGKAMMRKIQCLNRREI